MKRLVWIFLCLAGLTGFASAGESPWGASLGYGQGQDSVDIYRLGLLRQWQVRWLESDIGYVTGYFELSVNQWDGKGDAVTGVALSPVFQYMFKTRSVWHPYIEAGAGPAYIDDFRINNRDLSTHFQFEDRIGLGVRGYNLDLNFRYMHYSNASIKSPNDGIDILIGTLAWYF